MEFVKRRAGNMAGSGHSSQASRDRLSQAQPQSEVNGEAALRTGQGAAQPEAVSIQTTPVSASGSAGSEAGAGQEWESEGEQGLSPTGRVGSGQRLLQSSSFGRGIMRSPHHHHQSEVEIGSSIRIPVPEV